MVCSIFPDELIIEIFKDECFSRFDLARLALVSRRFLESVRQSLYETISVDLEPEKPDLDGATEEEEVFYSVNSWILLNTLKDKSALAALVKNVEFDFASWRGEFPNPFSSGIETTYRLAVSTFLRLVPNATMVTGMRYWYISPIGQVATRHPNIVKIRDRNLTFSQVHELSAKLELLHVDEFPPDQGTHSTPLHFPKLVHLDVQQSSDSFISVVSNGSTWPNLRTLKITADVAAMFDYSKLPSLEFLHLYPPPKTTAIGSYATMEKAWRLNESLGGLTSFRTLSLHWGRYADDWERYLSTGVCRHSGKSCPKPKIIQLNDVLHLDRIASILNSKLAECLERFILVTGAKWQHPSVARMIRAVEAMCEGTGVRLVMRSEPEDLWETYWI